MLRQFLIVFPAVSAASAGDFDLVTDGGAPAGLSGAINVRNENPDRIVGANAVQWPAK